MRGIPGGPVTAMGLAGGMSAHLAGIEKLSNGFVIRYQKPQKVAIKQRGLEAFGLDEEAREVMRFGMEKMKEGENWKGVPDELKAAAAGTPLEQWITVPMAVACKNEDELLSAIRDAVKAHGESEKLMLSGELQ